MAPRIRMPSTSDLPEGPRRVLVAQLFAYYRDAGRPTLREISDAIAGRDDLAGTASRETIRRMLLGISVPAQWETAHAVFLALCQLADYDPDEQHPDGYEGETRRSVVKDLWNSAIDEPDPQPSDPWGTSAPPF
jgi:hypothetical protein